MSGPAPPGRLPSGSAAIAGPVAVEDRHPGVRRRPSGAEPLFGDEDGGAGVVEHEGEAVGRVVGVERDVGAAGLEDGQQGDDHVDGPGRAEADEGLGADAQGAEAAGEPVGAGVELAVGERSLAVGDGDGLRSPVGLRLDPAMGAPQLRRRPARRLRSPPGRYSRLLRGPFACRIVLLIVR